jgi:type VI secretion system protein
VAAFAEGLGVSPDDIMAAGGVDFLRRAGELLRVALFGMVSASRTRALMKNEFRLDMTLVNATDNNPLKLSANGEQAVKHMLREEPGAFMPMDSAIAECFDDVKEHQLAMMAGMQGALLDLLDTVSPQELEKRFEKSRSGISLGSRSAKLWDAYCELHQELLAEDQLFASLFAEPFARAYDEQMNKLKQNRKTQDSSKGS